MDKEDKQLSHIKFDVTCWLKCTRIIFYSVLKSPHNSDASAISISMNNRLSALGYYSLISRRLLITSNMVLIMKRIIIKTYSAKKT